VGRAAADPARRRAVPERRLKAAMLIQEEKAAASRDRFINVAGFEVFP
jgi:hypothetical protein